MKKGETLLGALISFVAVDFIAWELLGAIPWPNDYSFMRPLILGILVIEEIVVLLRINVGE